MIKIKFKIPFTNVVFNMETSTLSNPSKWVVEWLGGGNNTSAGVSVNEDTAMRVTAYLAAVKILSEAIASLPLFVYKRDEAGGKARAPTHPAYDILHDMANDEMTAYTFRQTLQGHACSWGNGYAWIERDPWGKLKALWPLLPDRTFLERNKDTGKLQYRTRLHSAQVDLILDFWDVLHVPGFGFDGLRGYNPVHLAKEAIGLTLAAETFGSSFFGQGAVPSGIIEYPKTLSELAYKRYKEQVNEKHGGLSKSHKLMVLEEGLKYHQTTIPPETAQFLETRKFQIAEIARIFRVPLHMLQELDRSTNNNIEHQGIEFVVHTLRPWLVNWEQAIKMKLFLPHERKRGFFAEHQVDGLLRGDYKSRQEGLAIQRQNGIINADEWREIENRNPQEGDQGKIYLVNGNMITPQKASEGGEDNTKSSENQAG